VPTWAISVELLIGFEMLASSSTIAVTAASMPRLTWFAFAPAVMFLRPSVNTASA
jgi:hypothetical protein